MNLSDDSSATNITIFSEDMESNKALFATFVMLMGLLCLSIASTTFGIVSWIVLPGWRLFRHYVFVTLLLNHSVASFLLWALQWILPPVLKTCLAFTSKLAFSHWLMIITVMFYFDFVRVFTDLESTKYLYLKTNIFGWVLPVIWTVIAMFSNGLIPYAGMYLVFSICVLLMCINFIVYLSVLYALFKVSRVKGANQGIGKKATLSTFAFVFTGSVYLWPFLISFLKIPGAYQSVVFDLSYFVTILCLNVFFLMLKSHRELWTQRRLRTNNNVI